MTSRPLLICITLCVFVRECVRPLILCQDEESRHASLVSQWQGVIRAAKVLDTAIASYAITQTAASQERICARQFKTLFLCPESLSARKVWLPISIYVTHSPNQMPARELPQSLLVSTSYESINHLFQVQFFNNTNVPQISRGPALLKTAFRHENDKRFQQAQQPLWIYSPLQKHSHLLSFWQFCHVERHKLQRTF